MYSPTFKPLFLVLCGALGLSACAPLSALNPKPEIKAASNWSAAQSLSAGDVEWPQDRWWTAYGDSQLSGLIDEALANSPSLAAADARLRQASAILDTTDAASSPQVSANADVSVAKQSYNHLMSRAVVPKGEHGYGRTTLDFSWELDFWGRNRAAVAAATSAQAAALAESAQARLMLTTSITSAYAELARLFAAQDTARGAVEVRQKTAALFRERYQNGLETLGSVRQAESRYSAAQAELQGIQEQIALQRNRLSALLGKGPDRGLSINHPQVNLSKPMGLPKSIQFDLLGRRPDVVAARLRAEAAAKRIDVAQAEFYPNVNLNAFIGLQSLSLGMLTKSGSEIASVGPAISLPIFNGGRLKAQLKGARAEYDEAVANYELTVTQALQSVADAVVSQRELSGQLLHTRDSVAAAREAWEIARQRYEGGLSNYIDVLSAEDMLLSSQRGLSDLQSRSFALDVALVRALGGHYSSSQS